MKTLNSPKAGKVEIISFILLVLLSAAFFVWQNGKNSNPGKHALIIAPAESKITANHEADGSADTVRVPEMPDAVPVPPESKVKPLAAIIPPLPVHDIRMKENVVNANTGELITTKCKSQINIPARAFVDASGKVVEGNVQVSYREYHDFRDIFLSGIPMEYGKGMLESAGMIEINAAQNGVPVYVNPENKIRVMLASAYKDTDYNLYYLDQKEMKWKMKGKDEVVFSSPTKMPKNDPAFLLDSTENAFSFTQVSYQVRVVCRSDMNDRKKHWFSRKKSPEVFDFRLAWVDKVPAELKPILGITWRYAGDDAQDVYMNLFGLGEMPQRTKKSKTFNGYICVTENETAGPLNYRINFATEDFVGNIPVTPVFTSETEAYNFPGRWQKYTMAYRQAKNQEQRRIEKFRNDTAAYFSSNGHFKKQFSNGEAAALRTLEVNNFRTFEISNFGIWNCDRMGPEISNTVLARFTDEKGKPLKVKKGYFVIKSSNSVYTITDFENFPFARNAKVLFWTILPGNKLGVIYPEEFAKHAKDYGDCTFAMKINSTALSDLSNLKSALSFN